MAIPQNTIKNVWNIFIFLYRQWTNTLFIKNIRNELTSVEHSELRIYTTVFAVKTKNSAQFINRKLCRREFKYIQKLNMLKHSHVTMQKLNEQQIHRRKKIYKMLSKKTISVLWDLNEKARFVFGAKIFSKWIFITE